MSCVTSRSASAFVSIVIVTSAAAAASAGDAATSGNSSAFSLVRFQTTTSFPASRSRRAIRPPIAPRPSTATFTRKKLLAVAVG
jgi:hypothetical protein